MTMLFQGDQFMVIGSHLVKKASQDIYIGAEIDLDVGLREFIQQCNNQNLGGWV
jgi:hypothetical protein